MFIGTYSKRQFIIGYTRVLLNYITASILIYQINTGTIIVACILQTISFVLYVLSHYAVLNKNKDEPFNKRLFIFSLFSMTNYILDVSEVETSREDHRLIQILTGPTLAFLFILTTSAESIVEYWGCYNPTVYSTLSSLQYGRCPPRDTRTYMYPVCNQPHINCDNPYITTEEVGSYAIYIASIILICVFIIHIMSARRKIDYYLLFS